MMVRRYFCMFQSNLTNDQELHIRDNTFVIHNQILIQFLKHEIAEVLNMNILKLRVLLFIKTIILAQFSLYTFEIGVHNHDPLQVTFRIFLKLAIEEILTTFPANY